MCLFLLIISFENLYFLIYFPIYKFINLFLILQDYMISVCNQWFYFYVLYIFTYMKPNGKNVSLCILRFFVNRILRTDSMSASDE